MDEEMFCFSSVDKKFQVQRRVFSWGGEFLCLNIDMLGG